MLVSTSIWGLNLSVSARPGGHKYWSGGPIYKKISHDNLTIMPKLGSSYDCRVIDQTHYEELKAFLGYDLHAKSKDRRR